MMFEAIKICQFGTDINIDLNIYVIGIFKLVPIFLLDIQCTCAHTQEWFPLLFFPNTTIKTYEQIFQFSQGEKLQPGSTNATSKHNWRRQSTCSTSCPLNNLTLPLAN